MMAAAAVAAGAPMPPSADPVRLQALHARAQALETEGDLSAALDAYQTALEAAPDHPGLLASLARLARRMGLHEVALALWTRLATDSPDKLEAVDGVGHALRELHRHAEAVEVLRPAILQHPHEARLWNTLGTVLNAQGDSPEALIFFDEAVRLDPDFPAARHNRGGVHFDMGELAYAEADLDAALDLAGAAPAGSAGERAAIGFARGLLHLHRGELAQGWDAYEARLERPEAPVFDLPGARWTPDTPLDGRHLLVVGEQGLGDEAMFASLLPEVIEALGPHGRLSLAVEPRLVALFRRSFPSAQVAAYATTHEAGRLHRRALGLENGDRPMELWAPLGSLPRRFRRTLAEFPPRRAYLAPDPQRIAHWRAWLGDGRPAVGLSWRSGRLSGERTRQYPPLDAWAPVLAAPGVRFVNLQYGAERAELEGLATLAGAQLLEPPEIDLRHDLDDLCALATALDALVSVPNATAALAAACGVRVSFLTAPAAWPRLGTDAYPWYPRAQSFAALRFGEWGSAMAAAAAALTGLSPEPRTAPSR